MTEQRDMFKKALLEAMSEKYDNELSSADSIDIRCSKKHYSKLSGILGFNVRKEKRPSKRLIVTILAAALLLCSCTAYVYRDEIKGFFIEVYEKYIHGTYDADSKNTMGNDIQKPYQATYIPQGYVLVKETKNALNVYYEWKDSNGNTITMQQRGFDGTNFYIDSEHGITENIKLEQYDIYFRKNDNNFYYIWNDGTYVLSLNSTVQFSNDELLKIIKGFN